MIHYNEYVKHVYDVVKNKTEGFDAIYKDYIVELVGIHGFESLRDCKLIEGCGSINLRELYTLCPIK